MNTTTIIRIIQEEKVKEIALQFTDLSGILRTLWIPSGMFQKVIKEGIHTDGSSLGVVDVSKSDVKLLPDINSFIVLPSVLFPQRVARVVCDVYEPDSEIPFQLDPRFILKRITKKIKDSLGQTIISCASSEIEFFLFTKNEDNEIKLIDEAGYLATPPTDKGAELRLEISEELRKMGINIEKHHHEVPHGKSEFNLPYSEAVQMADTIYLIKFIIKLMAAQKNIIASFMPKPFHGEYGAGLHTHINLRDEEKNINIFTNPEENKFLSSIALKFMAGILTHAKALACLTNPSVNSYKRLVPGWEAPVYISWANYNRSTLIRIPPGDKKSARLEYRPTDGSCNFYLAYAGLLAAGLDGVQRNLEPPNPIEEDIYRMNAQDRVRRGIEVLPSNLGDAIREFSKDIYFKHALGEKFQEKYLEIKKKEWKNFSTFVHDWERKAYLDV